jgi:hypothetical protein
VPEWGQRRIAFAAIVDQYIGAPVLVQGFSDKLHRLLSHLWQFSDKLVVGRRSFLCGFVGHSQRGEQSRTVNGAVKLSMRLCCSINDGIYDQ